MPSLYLRDGKLLLKDGKLASDSACCCGGGACCLTGCAEYGSAAFMYTDTYAAIPDIEVVPDIPGYLKAQIAYGIFSYTRVVPCPMPEEGSPEYLDAEQAFYDALIAAIPDGMELYQEFPGADEYWSFSYMATGACTDSIVSPKCEEIGGVWHPGQTCAQSPCGLCCGIPQNCQVTINADVAITYDDLTNQWLNATGVNSPQPQFGDCRSNGAYIDGLGGEYASCCISFWVSGTPGVANPSDPCGIFNASIVGRLVCDSCCESEGDGTNGFGVNCRIEGVVKEFFQAGDCSAVQDGLDFTNWSISLTCDPEDGCNPLP